MNFFDKLTPEQKEMIVSLPYRVGVYVSEADSGSTDPRLRAEEQAQESRALSSILHGIAEEMFGSESVQHIMSATLRRREKWPVWAKEIDTVPVDCLAAVTLLKNHGEPKDAKAFRNHILEIAEAVALAFRETDPVGFARFKIYIQWLKDKLIYKNNFQSRTFDEFLRISTGERLALTRLAGAFESAG